MNPAPGVVLHSLLEYRGGAARVADMLARELAASGIPTLRTFEQAETPTGQEGLPRHGPERLLELAAQGWLVHLHATAHWPELLAQLRPAAQGRLWITLHDARLATGGCPYPLDCPYLGDCRDPCPRAFPHVAADLARNRHALRMAQARLVSPSRWLASLFGLLYPDLPAEVLANGVAWPRELPDKLTAKAALGLAPGARVVVFAAHGGQAAGYKAGGRWPGYWAGIKAEVPEAVGFLVGGEAAGRQGDLMVWPYVDEERLRGLLRAADVFCHPTLADNHPLVVLEAMSEGCPVVAFAAGGVPEQIDHGRTGILVRPGDDVAFILASAELLRAPSRGQALAATAYHRGRTRFAASRMAAAYRTLLGI